jgi:hypothetical protein
MSALAVAAPRPRPRTRHGKPIDHAFRALIHTVMVDGWQPEDAARSLLAAVHDDRRLLRLLRARVLRALLDRPSGLSTRAEATLDSALGALPPEQAGVPSRGDHHA